MAEAWASALGRTEERGGVGSSRRRLAFRSRERQRLHSVRGFGVTGHRAQAFEEVYEQILGGRFRWSILSGALAGNRLWQNLREKAPG